MGKKKNTIVVMGGGPAGIFTACGLADLGHAVTVISRPRPYPAWEGMSERPLTTLKQFDFPEAVAAIGPMVTRTAHWNGQSQAQNREYLVERGCFDQALWEDVRAKGITLEEGRIDVVARCGSGWQVSWRTGDMACDSICDFLVEARGREANVKWAGRGEKAFLSGPPTSALLKSYSVPPGPATTSVASFAKGWAWHLRDGKGAAILQIFIDSPRGALPAKTHLSGFFDDLITMLPEAADWLKDATAGPEWVSVRTAAARKTTVASGADFLVVGDSAMALDPLSGNGLFYALSCGLAAVPVINSLLRRPEARDLAQQFYQERLDLAFAGGCAMGREFYAAEDRWPEEDFWRARRAWPEDAAPSHPDPHATPARLEEKPVVEDGFIVSRKVIVTTDHPRGVWQVDNVPVVALFERLTLGCYDDEKNAIFLNVRPDQVAVARKWLAARRLIDDHET